MLRAGILFLFLLHKSPLARAWFSFKLSDVKQCAPVTLTFRNNTKGGNKFFSTKPPSSVVILPLNSPPLSIPVANVTDNTTSVTVSFLPLVAGTSFLVSLEDEDGMSTGFVSDIIPVQPSQADDTTCLPSTSNQTRFFNVDALQLSQCIPFSIQYNATIISDPPIVKAYIPRGFSFRLNTTSMKNSPGVAEYQTSLFRGAQALLSIQDPEGSAFETSNLTTVGGDALSSKACLRFSNSLNDMGKATNMGAGQQLSQSTVAGIGAAIGTVVACSIIVVSFLVMRTRRRRHQLGVRIPDTNPESPPPPEKAEYPTSSPVVANPPYVAAEYSPPPSPERKGRPLSLSSFVDTMFSSPPRTPPALPPEIKTPANLSILTIPPSVHRRPSSVDVPVTPSVVGLWIDGSQPVPTGEKPSRNQHLAPPGTRRPAVPISARESMASWRNLTDNPFNETSRTTYRETEQRLRMFRPQHQTKPSVQSSMAGSVYFVPESARFSAPLDHGRRNDNRF